MKWVVIVSKSIFDLNVDLCLFNLVKGTCLFGYAILCKSIIVDIQPWEFV